jgi:hypothetical protein
MRNTALIIFTILIFNNNIISQKEEWTVKSGEDMKQSIPDSIKFLYPQFTTGLVYFKDGKISKAQLNYNLLFEEMQFIDTSKDTLAIANEATIKFIAIDSDSFYYDKAYLQTVMNATSIKLAKRESLKIADVQKISAYDQPSSTSSINTINRIYTTLGQTAQLNGRANIVFVKQTSYYIGDKYDHFLPATKKNVIKMFGRKENEIENFVNQNKITFNNEEDLKKLVSFLQNI